MDFKDNKPIYLQIAALIAERIVVGVWVEDERIPSVRDLGTELGVNPNTCMRAYELLTREEVIANRRGIGYSVCVGGRARVMDMSRREFVEETLPEIFNQMQALGITIEQVVKIYNNISTPA